MSFWPSAKAKKVLKALKSIGWSQDPNDKTSGSHVNFVRDGWPKYTWAFGDGDEIGPKMMARIAKHTGLEPSDL